MLQFYYEILIKIFFHNYFPLKIFKICVHKIEEIISRLIDIKAGGNYKNHVTVILAVTGSGNKLPPILIFKGKSDKINERRYNKLDVVRNKKIFIFFQENAWVNDSIFKNWIDLVFKEHEKNLKDKCLLLLDKAPSHITKNVLSYFKSNQIEYILIPARLTRFLQPLDIGVNFPFKTYLKNKYLINEANKLTNNNEVNPIKFNDNLSYSNLDILRLNLIYWILLIWEDDDIIKLSTIIASFNKATITFPLDGSFDNKFEMPEEIIKQHNKE